MVPKGSAVTFSADVDGPVAYVYWWNSGVATYSTNYTVQNVQPPAAHSPTLYVNYGSPMFGTVRSVPSLSVTVGSTLLLSAPTVGGNGDVTFKILSGTVATQIEVQSSEELTTWAPVATVTATNGMATYVHQATSNQLNRFFRAVASP